MGHIRGVHRMQEWGAQLIFRSNLTAPNLTPFFKHIHVRPMAHSMGHSVPSDWADKAEDDPVFGIYKKCGMFTHDEAAILYNVGNRLGGWCVDIGAHTCWGAIHLSAARCEVMAVDPMYGLPEFRERASENSVAYKLVSRASGGISLHAMTSESFFARAGKVGYRFKLTLIDGDHEPGKPLEDAINAAKHLADTGVIVFHDGTGLPVREAVQYLMAQGFYCRPYFSPHMMYVCWRGDFTPPDHVPDPNVKAQLMDGRLKDFDFTKCR
jgi:hypothetical protein